MSQWGQTPYQYPMQTGYPGSNSQFQQNQQFQQHQQQQNPQQNPQFQQQPGYAQGLQSGFPAQRPQGFQQPQQTGFPGQPGFLQQQQTGFPGQGSNFQQRPIVPPVPPIPNQFQQQQNAQGGGFMSAPPQPPRPPPQPSGFLSSSPGFGVQPTGFAGGGLVAQPTGFPVGRGSGGPIVPQMTGFIDPRLQMMQSTFMPANISAPYSAGGLPQLQPQSQQFSLQQSFQQHNQAQRGTAAPKIPWALSKAEKKNYDQIFRAWDAQSTGFISGQTALEVFGQSGLDKNDLARIWTLADADNRGKLNMAEFHVAMGLIYRKLNGNIIPDELPAELVPPSSRDLDTSVNFLKDILKNDTRTHSPSTADGPISRLPERSFNSNTNSSRAGGRQDATVYKHSDSEPPSGIYQPRSRHVDRSAVRSNSESDSPAADLSDMKKQLENTAKMLDRASEADASRTAEDEALEREMADLKYRVKRVQEDLEYVSRGPRSAGKDEERRKLERELLKLMHERVPEVERKIEERERRKEREKREWARVRDRRNDRFGRYDDDRRGEERSYTPSVRRYEEDEEDRPYSRASYDRDEKPYRRDRDRDRSRDRDYDRPRSPPAARSPPPPPPTLAVPSKPSPAPTRSPAPSTKNMTPEERQAFIRAEAKRRMEERMQALGVMSPASSASPSHPTLDTSVEDRLAQEKKEAEEKARAAERQAEERERLRRERLEGEKALKDGRNVSAPVPAPIVTTPATKTAPPPPKPRAPAPPPPRKTSGVARPTIATKSPAPPAPVPPPPAPAPPPPAPPPAEPLVDPEEEAFRAREEALRKRREERAAQLRRLEQEEEEARLAEEAYNARRAALTKARSATPSPVPPAPPTLRSPTPPPPPPPPPPVAEVAAPAPKLPAPSPPVVGSPPSKNLAGDKSSTNPFSKFMTNGASIAPATSAAAAGGSGNNPFFRPQTAPPPSAPTPPKSPIQTPVKTSYHTAPGNDDDEWDDIVEKDEGDSSDDEIVSSRSKRDEIAKQLFGNILPPPRPQSAAASTTASVPLSSSPAPPPAPPAPPLAPVAPPAPAPTAAAAFTPAPPGDRGALLGAIQGGLKLRKAVTNDRSAAPVSGQVLGDAAPPSHINATPRPASPPVLPPTSVSREEDFSSSIHVPLPATMEENEDEVEHNLPASSVPQIHVSEPAKAPEEATDDLMADVDKSVEYRVRSLYPYEGQRPEDLTFGENLVLLANPSKTEGDWWYGTLVRDGSSGFFPKTYVHPLVTVKATALYSYTGGNADELPFAEGDELSIVDRSEQDWWKAEQDGVIFIVPAAYLEVAEANTGVTSTVVTLASANGSQPQTQKITNPEGTPSDKDQADELSDSSDDDDYFSVADADEDSDDEGDLREETDADWEARQKERQRVLEAAGLIVNEDVKPPPRLERVRSVRKRRPPPAAPRRSSIIPDLTSKDLPPVPEAQFSPIDATARLDDAFDRYETFKHGQGNTNRLSIASSFETALSSPGGSPAISQAPSTTRESESRPYSQLFHFLGRRTPAHDGPEKRTLTISGPILNQLENPSRENSPAFGSSWASLVDKTVLQELPKGERRRQEAIFELINTEADYVRDLQLIVEVFYSSMIPLLDTKAVTVIFANIEDILLTNTTFLSSLEERQKECRLYVDKIGDILQKNMPNLAVYMAYCANQGAAIKVLQSQRDKSPELASHLQRLRDDPAVRNLDLSSYLLVPMQRITKYPLLIRQILQYTDTAQDRNEIERSLQIAETVLNNINETIRDQEGHERLKNISEDLWVGQGRLDLTAPTRYMGQRKLVKEGVLLKAKSGRKLRAFLCSDIMVLTDDAAKTLYRMPIPLAEVQVKDTGGGRDDLTFQIAMAYPRGGDAIVLRAMSVRDCQLWMQVIDEASRRCREAEKACHKSS